MQCTNTKPLPLGFVRHAMAVVPPVWQIFLPGHDGLPPGTEACSCLAPPLPQWRPPGGNPAPLRGGAARPLLARAVPLPTGLAPAARRRAALPGTRATSPEGSCRTAGVPTPPGRTGPPGAPRRPPAHVPAATLAAARISPQIPRYRWLAASNRSAGARSAAAVVSSPLVAMVVAAASVLSRAHTYSSAKVWRCAGDGSSP